MTHNSCGCFMLAFYEWKCLVEVKFDGFWYPESIFRGVENSDFKKFKKNCIHSRENYRISKKNRARLIVHENSCTNFSWFRTLIWTSPKSLLPRYQKVLFSLSPKQKLSPTLCHCCQLLTTSFGFNVHMSSVMYILSFNNLYMSLYRIWII